MFDALQEATRFVAELERSNPRRPIQPIVTFGSSKELIVVEGELDEYEVSGGQLDFTLVDRNNEPFPHRFVARGRSIPVILDRTRAVFRLYCELSPHTGVATVRDLSVLDASTW